MEDIYFGGFYGPRKWCSGRVKLKPYFDKYCSILSGINLPRKRTKNEINILKFYLPESEKLSLEEKNKLVDNTYISQLTALLDEDLVKNNLKDVENELFQNKEKITELEDKYDKINSTQSSSIVENNIKKPNRIKQEKSYHMRRDITVDPAEKRGMKDLNPRENFIVSFRIHEPYCHLVGDTSRPAPCSQEIALLGHQRLTELRDKIVCQSDFQDIRGDVSNNPDVPGTSKARDVYYSGMFYFDNTFYIDRRHWSNKDYSEPIRKWAAKKNIAVGETKLMENMKVEDLEIRFGYPYLYMHQGCCEHVILISSARLLTPKDSLYSLDYPLMKKVSHHSMIFCMLCSRFPAKWIVRGCDMLAHEPTYECKNCFKSFHYINGKKVGRFKAYQYWQKGSIL